jgi:hypothetical protein
MVFGHYSYIKFGGSYRGVMAVTPYEILHRPWKAFQMEFLLDI